MKTSYLSIFIFFTVLFISHNTLSENYKQVSAQHLDEAKKEIMEVVEDFKQSITDKDEKKFIDLFYDKSIPWIGIDSKRRKGNLPSESGVIQSNHLSFIRGIVKKDDKVEEKIWDIEIMTDGEIASVHFKYSYHRDNYKKNWGDESWQMIKTPDGWKINSVIYSITRNPVPKKL